VDSTLAVFITYNVNNNDANNISNNPLFSLYSAFIRFYQFTASLCHKSDLSSEIELTF